MITHGFFWGILVETGKCEWRKFNLEWRGGEDGRGFYTRHLRENMNEKHRAFQKRGEMDFSQEKEKKGGSAGRVGISQNLLEGAEGRFFIYFSEEQHTEKGRLLIPIIPVWVLCPVCMTRRWYNVTPPRLHRLLAPPGRRYCVRYVRLCTSSWYTPC